MTLARFVYPKETGLKKVFVGPARHCIGREVGAPARRFACENHCTGRAATCRGRLGTFDDKQKETAMSTTWNDTRKPLSEKAVRWVVSRIEGLDFGDVKIAVRAGKIVQIDREEKQRHHEVMVRP